MIGILYLTGIVIYLFCGVVFAVWHFRNRNTWKKMVAIIAFLFFTSLPFTDFYIQFVLVQIRTLFSQPLTQSSTSIATPNSVYWEDNVWPGFDEYTREWMVDNYLDGTHLRVLAMKGDDGIIYLYEYGQEGAKQFKFRDNLPLIDYHVTFTKSHLSLLEEQFLWSDRIEIHSTQDDKMIGYSKRYCGYGWWLGYYPLGDFCKGYAKGKILVFEFVHDQLFSYTKLKGINVARSRDYLRKKYNKLIQ